MTTELSRVRNQKRQDRRLVSKLLDRELGRSEEVHHHTDGTLILCKDHAQHKLAHRIINALKACSHASWRKCQFCKEYDSPSDLEIYARRSRRGEIVYHLECKRKHERNRLQLRNLRFLTSS